MNLYEAIGRLIESNTDLTVELTRVRTEYAKLSEVLVVRETKKVKAKVD